jgi:Uncharacterized ABC-type transport system, periplasmic component/surface lipoprotein
MGGSKMKKVISLMLVLVLMLSMTACSSKKQESNQSPTGTGTKTEEGQDTKGENSSKKDAIKVGIVLSTGGLGDKNFNDMAYAGLLKAQETLGIQFDYVEPKSVSDFVPQHRMFAESGEYDLIIGIGNDQGDAISEVAADFPDQKFSIIDSSIDVANVSSISTKWQEQTFLCGVIAGLGTKSKMDKANEDNIIGVILGKDLPNLRQGVVGFTAGARYVNPDVEVLEATVGDFNDPGKAKEIALSMYNRGADFIQHIAGASGLGMFNAAKEADKYAFGVGGNQNAIEPDYIVATSLRNVDEIVYNEVKALVDGNWSAGIHVSGIKEGSVGYSVDASNVKLPEDILKVVEDAKKKIISGELVPCDDSSKLDDWVAKNQYYK